MDIRQVFSGFTGCFLGCSMAIAGSMGEATQKSFQPVVALQGGYAAIDAGRAQSFLGTSGDVFTYRNLERTRNTGFIGVFLGVEHSLPLVGNPDYFMQAGVEYDAFGRINVHGIHEVGVDPNTSTRYRYDYNFQTQQVLGTLRVFKTLYERVFPYAEVGLGAAFNRGTHYGAVTNETGSINLTPIFMDQNHTQFSYSLGLGVDMHVNDTLRAGLGYRYSNFGSKVLRDGLITFNNYEAPVSFGLGRFESNQFIARITYVV